MKMFGLYPKDGKNDSRTIEISTITEEMEAVKKKDANLPISVNNGESVIGTIYNNFEKKILRTLEAGGIYSRPEASSGFWLSLLIGMCAIATFQNDIHVTEIPLLGVITGIGLISSSICLIIQLLISKSASKNFQVLYLPPVCMTSTMFFLAANKELILSLSWGLSIGSLGTWGVLQIMSKFPKRFTLGEATIITHGILLFLLSNGPTSPMREVIPPGFKHPLATAVWEAGISFVGLLCLLYAFYPRIQSTYYFFLIALGLLLIHLSPWLYFVKVDGVFSYEVIYLFTLSGRFPLIIYWAICILIGTVIITYQVFSKSCATHAARWTFIFCAVSIIIPGLSHEPRLLHLISGIMMGVFIVFELIKFIFESTPHDDELKPGSLGEKNVSVSFSPLYLYLGIAFPMWMHITSSPLPARLSGVITIAIGDTAARIVGSKWGKNKWAESNKTIEGTIACILSLALCMFGLFYFGSFDIWRMRHTLHILLVIGVSLVEGITDQNDNLVLPFLFYIGFVYIN